jgi:pimeloyl-ACP methyl ester carboxylesterase
LHRVESADSTQIAVWKAGVGPPLLLVHGTTADHTRWARVSPILEKRFTVFAMDRRGRGESTDTLPYAIQREGEDVAAVAEWIGSAVTVLGHSYGAICAIEAALRTPAIRRLVLYEPPIPTGLEMVAAGVLENVADLLEQGDPEQALVVFFREVVKVPEQQLEVLRSQPVWPKRIAAAHTLVREMRIEGMDQFPAAELNALRIPVTLLLGTDSPEMLKAGTRHVHAAVSHSEIVEMAGQQHVAMDLIPEEFAQLVTAAARA